MLGGAVDHLVLVCTAARAEGADFPTVWHTILRTHHLVAGIPVQGMENGQPVLKVRLIGGRQLVHGSHGYWAE